MKALVTCPYGFKALKGDWVLKEWVYEGFPECDCYDAIKDLRDEVDIFQKVFIAHFYGQGLDDKLYCVIRAAMWRSWVAAPLKRKIKQEKIA